MLEADASSHTGCVVYLTAVCDWVAECFSDPHAYLVAYSRIQTNRKHPKYGVRRHRACIDILKHELHYWHWQVLI